MPAEIPDWLQALIDAGTGTAEGLRWLTPEERAAAAADRPGEFDVGMLWLTNAMRAAAAEAWPGKILVGAGPKTYSDHTISWELELWLDTAAPDQLWVAFPKSPPFLWFSGGRTAESLLAAVRPYLPTDLAAPRPFLSPIALVRHARESVQNPIPEPDAHTRVARVVLSFALSEDGTDLGGIENHLIWCGAADPRFVVQGTAMGNPNSNPETTVVRTLYSRAAVRLDYYEGLDGALVGEIRYAPAGQHDAVAAFNEQFGRDFPTDVPVDVPFLLLGLEAIGVPRLQSYLATRHDVPDFLQSGITFLVLLTRPNVADVLRPFAGHPSAAVRGSVVFYAARYARDLVREMSATETDPELREKMAAALAEPG